VNLISGWNACFHFCDKLFWRAIYADTLAKFNASIADLAAQSEHAAKYVLAIPDDHWATYAFHGRRFGHCTSNLAEIANSLLRSIRELPLLEMLDALYRHQMEKFYNRYKESAGWVAPLNPVPLSKFS
jgi:hypothetical protein